MTEDKIVKLLIDKGFGSARLPILPVSGGFLHRIYKVDTETGSYAVKHLNPNIMQRPSAMGNFKRAEALESVLESAGIPIVPALTIGGSKMQNDEVDDVYKFAYIGVMPSFHEQCSYTAIEMMRHGIPIVGTDSTGLAEMLDATPQLRVHIDEDSFNERTRICIKRRKTYFR